jgi:DNA-binding SARP family transcriptional activator
MDTSGVRVGRDDDVVLDLCVLGNLEVSSRGVNLALPAGMASRLLQLLLIEPEGVTDSAAIDCLWHGTPPTNALFSLRNLISKLRQVLGASVIVRRQSSYAIDLAQCRLDSDRFGGLLADARQLFARGDFAQTAVLLDEAALLVRGEVFADIRDEPWARAAVAEFDERVRAAQELWAEARLRDGHVSREIARLHAAARSHPEREIRWRQLIDAFRLAGRRTEAMRASREARRALAEFGLSPSAELLACERSIIDDATITQRSSGIRRRPRCLRRS